MGCTGSQANNVIGLCDEFGGIALPPAGVIRRESGVSFDGGVK